MPISLLKKRLVDQCKDQPQIICSEDFTRAHSIRLWLMQVKALLLFCRPVASQQETPGLDSQVGRSRVFFGWSLHVFQKHEAGLFGYTGLSCI